MRPRDFRHLTPAEFEAVVSEFNEAHQEAVQGEWERMRLLASITIQPHLRRRLTPRQLLPLPWDNNAPAPKHQGDNLSKEERLKRLSRRLGKK